jgi:hypothetical protein
MAKKFDVLLIVMHDFDIPTTLSTVALTPH